jgi:hypothetical protein
LIAFSFENFILFFCSLDFHSKIKVVIHINETIIIIFFFFLKKKSFCKLNGSKGSCWYVILNKFHVSYRVTREKSCIVYGALTHQLNKSWLGVA